MGKAKKLVCAFITFTMVLTSIQLFQVSALTPADDITSRLGNAVSLFVDSPVALVNNIETLVDKSNAEVVPFIRSERTLVPVRFVSENLGAKVDWNAKTTTVTITKSNKVIKFTVGSKKMMVGSIEITLDVAAEIANDRAFIPFRAISEALGKKVFYDRGLIILSDKDNIFNINTEKLLIDEVISKVNNLPVIGTYDNLKVLLANSQGNVTDGIAPAPNVTPVPLPVPTSAPAVASASTPAEAPKSSDGALNTDYSTTNLQVEGVDEADVVKTDGECIYQVNKQRIIVAKAYPAKDMKVLSILSFKDASFTPSEMYLNGQQLVVIGSSYNYVPVYSPQLVYSQAPINRNTVKAIIYDISDKSNLKQIREVEIEGQYVSSRMINTSLYLIANDYIGYWYYNQQAQPLTPSYRDTTVKNNFINIDYTDIRYFPGVVANNYMVIAGINLSNNEGVKVSTYLGAGQNVYVSQQNLYVAVNNNNYYGIKTMVATPDVKVAASGAAVSTVASAPAITPVPLPPVNLYDSNTLIYKFSLAGSKVTYLSKGDVPGTILNQFSMDENGKYFRIATTKGETWGMGESVSKNNLYILDEMMKLTGKIEDIAPGEKIYSVRFMGDRAYMVTFKLTDPLFVMDLKDPYKPAIVGALKIPGYSDYLQPYDENHIIGFGKDSLDVPQKDGKGNVIGTASYYLGMKIALFDVTDVNNPKEMFSEKIGDRGTDSELLRNHKALLFDKDKGLLAFPVTLYEVKNNPNTPSNVLQYGQFTFQGAYVYNISLSTGFTLKAKISHMTSEDYLKTGYYGYPNDKYINRILYIKDTLYTLSNAMFKANGLFDMKEVNSMSIPGAQTSNNIYPPSMPMPAVTASPMK